MQSVEDLGFSVMADYKAKLTMTEGIVLGAGAVLALAASHMASKSLAESAEIPIKKIKDFAHKLTKNQEFMKTMKENDSELKLVPFSKWKQDDFAKRLEGAARFALETGASVGDLQRIFKCGGGVFLQTKNDLPPMIRAEKDALLRFSKQPENTVRNVLGLLKDMGVRANRPVEDYWSSGKQADDNDYRLAWSAINRMSRMSPRAGQLLEKNVKWDLAEEYGFPALSRDFAKAEISAVADENIGPAKRKALEPLIEKLAEQEFDSNFPDFPSLLQKISENRSREDLENLDVDRFEANDLYALASMGKTPIPSFQFVRMNRTPYGSLDWEQYEKDIQDLQVVPGFYKEMVTPSLILKLWRLAEKNEDAKKAIFTAKAAMEAVGSDSEKMRFSINERMKYLSSFDPVLDEAQSLKQKTWWVDGLSALIKNGTLKKFDQAHKAHGGKSMWDYHDDLGAYLQYADKVGDWSTLGELKEKMAVLYGEKSIPATAKDKEIEASFEALERNRARGKSNKLMRARDRLAKRDPEWAISEYPEEYRRGRRIARFLDELVKSVEYMVKKGNTVVVHGRDGELLYDLLMRRPGIDKSKVRYAITSRPVTTWAPTEPLTEHHRQELQRYYDYLGRMVPAGAVHIDTGFAGSIPRWLDQQGFEVKSIAMVSANRPEEQLPVSMDISDRERRDIVLSDLEHSSQRLDVLSKYDPQTGVGGFGGMTYSLAAPGYHARAYGVYDELGLPRIRQKTPETRFEGQRRFRVAVDAPSDEPETLMEEDVLLKVK